MAETSTIFGFMKYVSATDILSDFKKTVDGHFVNSLKGLKEAYIIINYFVFSMISVKLSSFKLAPPINAPSISG